MGVSIDGLVGILMDGLGVYFWEGRRILREGAGGRRGEGGREKKKETVEDIDIIFFREGWSRGGKRGDCLCCCCCCCCPSSF